MSKSRLVRLFAALVIAASAIFVLYPRIFNDIHSNGTINARVVTFKSPINGNVARSFPVIGAVVEGGSLLTEIVDDRANQAEVGNLRVEYAQLQSRSSALEERLKQAQAMSASLRQRVQSYEKHFVESLTFQVREAAAEKSYWEAIFKERKRTVERDEKLVARGVVSPVDLADAQSEMDEAKEEIAMAQANIDRYAQELEAAKQGVFISDGQNDVPYSRQRSDELEIKIADLQLTLGETKGRLSALEGQLATQETLLKRLQSVQIHSPMKSIVWRQLVNLGSYVSRDDTLLKVIDCRTIYVEVPIPEESAEHYTIGTPVEVRLQGTDIRYAAKVSEIRGTRSVSETIEYSSAHPLLKKDEVLLVATFHPKDAFDHPEDFCNVGRRAEITLAERSPSRW